MSVFGFLIYKLINIYSWFVIFYVLLNILIAFNVINNSNQFISIVMNFLFKIIEPILNQIRKVVPNFGNIDITPLLLLILLETIQYAILKYSV